MRASDLTDDELFQLMCQVAKRRDWLNRVIDRMDARGWDKTDPTYLAAVAAYDAIHAVVRALHASKPKEPVVKAPKFFRGDDATS